MLKRNIQIFLLWLVIVLLLILFKESQIFDLGFVFRLISNPQKITNQLLLPADDLQADYQKLLAENSRLQALEQENKTLREFFNFQGNKEYGLVIANILGRDSINQNLVIIDVGQEQGLVIGQAVVVNQGIMVGKIIEVRQGAAVVRLLSDNQTKLGVAVGDSQSVSGLLTGSLGLGMNLSYVPQEQEIKKDDLVVTNNLNENIPSGLVVGKVENVEFSQEELFKNASVSPLVDYTSLSLVAIIVSS